MPDCPVIFTEVPYEGCTVPCDRTLTINGISYDLSEDRSWTVGAGSGTVTSIATTGPITGGPITTTGTIGITQASGSVDGYLSAADWTTFNGKQAQLSGTGFVKISGTTISYDNSTYYLASNPSAYIALTALSSGTGISYNNTTGVITNSAPDQTVVLTNGTGISISGTYPNFTITNTSPSSGGTVTSVGTGTGLTGGPITSTGTISLANTAVTPGSYTLASITVDAQGRLTAASSGSTGITPAALTKTDDTNVTLTLGGTPSIALLQATSITVGWTGTLADSRIASAATWNAKEPAITAGTTLQYWRGDKTFQTLNTSVVPESGNLYLTNARVIASTLTGYTSSPGTISSSDSVLTAIQKLNGNIGALTTGVSSVNSLTGAVPLAGTANQIAISGSNVFSLVTNTVLPGAPTTTTPSTADNSTKVATTAYVQAQGYLTNNQTITLSGDVSGSGSTSITTTIGASKVVTSMVNANAVTYAKLQQASTVTLLGNPTGSTANVQEITLGSGLNFSAGTLVATGTGGTVTSVALSLPSIITVSGSPVTTSGTLTGTLASQSANLVFAGPTTGSAAAPTFRSIVNADIPSTTINGGGITFGTTNTITAAAGTLTGATLNSTVVSTSITSTGTMTSGTLSTGYVVGGVTMTLGSDANYDTYYRNSSGVLTRLGNGTTGQVLTATTGAAPSWGPAGTGTVTSIATNNGLTGGTITTSGTIGLAAIAATSVLANTTGGSAAPSTALGYSSSGTAASLLKQSDANANISANNFPAGFTDVTSAAGTTTLTVGSTQSYRIKGSTTQTVVLPSTSVIGVTGFPFYIYNTSTGAVTVQANGGTTLIVMAASSAASFITVGTTNLSTDWQVNYQVYTTVNPTYTINTATDAAYIIATTWSYTELPVITANRVVTLPTGVAGNPVLVSNQNTSGTFSWSFSGTVKDGANNTVTILTNGVTYNLLYQGSFWRIISRY